MAVFLETITLITTFGHFLKMTNNVFSSCGPNAFSYLLIWGFLEKCHVASFAQIHKCRLKHRLCFVV